MKTTLLSPGSQWLSLIRESANTITIVRRKPSRFTNEDRVIVRENGIEYVQHSVIFLANHRRIQA